MGFLALLAWAVLATPQESAADSVDATVSVPPALSSAPVPPGPEGALASRATEDKAAAGSAAIAIPAQDPPRSGRLLEDRADTGPGVSSFVVGSLAVVGLLGGALLLLRRFGRSSRFLGTGGPIKVLARKPLGAKQELLLVEVGPRILMIGSTREHLSALGEITGPDEVAALRAGLSPRGDDSQRAEFRESLREGLRDQEAPREERVFASIADELAEIRK